jgi:hypothetical protein
MYSIAATLTTSVGFETLHVEVLKRIEAILCVRRLGDAHIGAVPLRTRPVSVLYSAQNKASEILLDGRTIGVRKVHNIYTWSLNTDAFFRDSDYIALN